MCENILKLMYTFLNDTCITHDNIKQVHTHVQRLQYLNTIFPYFIYKLCTNTV